MEKSFFEAFPNLKLEGVQRDLFEQVMVERITTTRRRDLLRIYIRSERLIEKEQVYSVEREIKKQFFPREYMTIKIYEKFVLSEQYTPEKLMELYRESLLVEIRECDHMLYAMFRQADVQFPEEHTMELVLEDSVIAKSKEDELVTILDKVLNERCGFHVKFQIAYREARASKYREDDELRIQKIVEGISIRLGSVVRGNEAVAATDAAELPAPQAGGASEPVRAATTKDAAASAGTERKVNENKTFEKKTYEKKSYGRFEKGGDKGFQRRALKRSDNPNVIFGRDFEDESIDIEEIWGEMGEVTIRGKVRALETREIRNERTIRS